MLHAGKKHWGKIPEIFITITKQMHNLWVGMFNYDAIIRGKSMKLYSDRIAESRQNICLSTMHTLICGTHHL